MNNYLNMGFSYTTSIGAKKGNIVIEFSVTYYDMEIYYQHVSNRIDCKVLFENICKSYLEDIKLK
jgi:hypothetical protein